MKISELNKEIKLGKEVTCAYGIIVDELTSDVFTSIREIGIVAELEEGENTLSLDVIDTVLSYVAVNSKVILEIPFSLPIPPIDIIILSLNCGIDISVIAPGKDASDEEWEQYQKTLCEYTSLWMSKKNSKNMVYPSSGFLQYMISEVFGFQPDTISSESYMVEHFVDQFPLDKMDKIKDELRVIIHNHFGGQHEFKVFAHSLAKAVATNISSKSASILEAIESKDLSQEPIEGDLYGVNLMSGDAGNKNQHGDGYAHEHPVKAKSTSAPDGETGSSPEDLL